MDVVRRGFCILRLDFRGECVHAGGIEVSFLKEAAVAVEEAEFGSIRRPIEESNGILVHTQ